MPPSLTLHLHGGFSATAADGTPLNLSLRGRAILAVTALGGPGGVGREWLAALIWCDRSDEQARASLRQELSALRRGLPPDVLRTDRTTVRLAPGQVEVATPPPGAKLLAGFALRSDAFEEWRRQAQTADFEQRVSQDIAAAQAASAHGDHLHALTAAKRAATLDPASEIATRIWIEAEAALGNRAGALEVYARLTVALRETLDVTPDAQTEALITRIRAGEGRPSKPVAAAACAAGQTPVLAVLPFEELGTPKSDMFADGIVEELTSALSRTDAFKVIARQSAFALAPSEREARAAAARLGADYLVEGSLRRSATRLRLSVQLVAGETGVTHWAERFDDEIDDVFDVQDRIAAQVTGHLAPHLRNAEIDRAHRTPKTARSAYQQILSALPHFWAHRREENARAMAHLEAALRIKPSDPVALGYMAWVTGQKCTYHWSDDPARDRAIALDYIERAGHVAGDNPAVLTALSAALSLLNVDFPLSRTYVDRALAVDPNNAWAWMRSGWVAVYENETQTALAHLERAQTLSPLDPFRFNIHLGRAAAFRQIHRFEEALAEIEAGRNAGPGVSWAIRMEAGTHELMGNHDAALDATRRWRAHYPDLTAQNARNSLPKWQHERAYIEGLYRLIDEVWAEAPA